MADKKKKRGGRRAHLNDFHVDLAGNYVYTGNHYAFVAQGRELPRVRRELWGLTAAILMGVFAGGCSDAPAMLNCWYVILPYAAETVAAVSVLWAMVRLSREGDPLREYVYKATAKALPHRAMLCMISAGLGFATMLLYLMLNDAFGVKTASALMYLLLKLLVGGGAWLLWRYTLVLHWEKVPGREVDQLPED